VRGRCVTCGCTKDQHILEGQRLKCSGSAGKAGYSFGSMDLPDGKHCRDCIHIHFCTGFIGDVKDNTACDWFPIRFYPAPGTANEQPPGSPTPAGGKQKA
jgi:hypothetical protein